MRSKGYGESSDVTEVCLYQKTKPSMKCPVCGLRAVSRYTDHANNKFIYKHNRSIKGTKGSKVTATIYHAADS